MQNIEDIKGLIRRRIKIFLFTAIPLSILAIAVTFILPPIYVSKSTIIVEAQRIPEEYVKTTVTSYVEERLQLITQRIMSRDKLLEIIKQFNLYPDMADKYATETIIEKMRGNIVFDTVQNRSLQPRRGMRPSTLAFSLSFEDKNPSMAQKVASVLASLYLEENFKKREEQAASTSLFLQQEINRLKQQINDYANKISEFKQAHFGELPENMTTNLQALDRLNGELQDVNMQIRSIQERKIYLEGQLANLDVTAPVITGQRDQSMTPRQRLESLRQELMSLQSTLSAKHPDIKKLQREIRELEGQVKQTGTRPGSDSSSSQISNPAYLTLKTQLDTSDIDLRNLTEQREQLKIEIGNYQKRIETIPLVERDYNNLTQDYTNAQQKYNEMMNMLMEANVAKGMEETKFGERFSIIEPAEVPTVPEKPNRRKILLMGLFLSLGLAGGLAYLQEMLDHSVKTPGEFNALFNVPVLSVIPLMENQQEKELKRKRAILFTIITFGLLFMTLLLFHFYVMPLDIFMTKLQRKLLILM